MFKVLPLMTADTVGGAATAGTETERTSLPSSRSTRGRQRVLARRVPEPIRCRSDTSARRSRSRTVNSSTGGFKSARVPVAVVDGGNIGRRDPKPVAGVGRQVSSHGVTPAAVRGTRFRPDSELADPEQVRWVGCLKNQ
jgi:hypothetical protein